MGSCCAKFSTRDVYTVLSGRLPVKHGLHKERDALYKAACDRHYELWRERKCTVGVLVETLKDAHHIQKLGGGVVGLCQKDAASSAIRYGKGMLNFRQRRQRAALSDEGQGNDVDATAVPLFEATETTVIARHELRYFLHYVVMYFRLLSVLEECAGSGVGDTVVDLVAFRVSRTKIQTEFQLVLPGRQVEEAYDAVRRETAHCFGLSFAAALDAPLSVAAFAEYCIASLFYEEITTEDDPPMGPQSGAALAEAGASECSTGQAAVLAPVPPASSSHHARPTNRRFQDMVGGVDDGAEDNATERRATDTDELGTEEIEGKHPGEEGYSESVVRGENTTNDKNEKSSAEMPSGTTKEATPSRKRNPATRTVNGATASSPFSPASRGSSQESTTSSNPLFVMSSSVRTSLDMWRQVRAQIPFHALEENMNALRGAMFTKFDTKQRGTLDEMDLYKGAQQFLFLHEVFPSGGSVVSQAVSSAFVAATHRLPSDVAAKGISSLSRFHVFVATLTALLDIHFAMKEVSVREESARLAKTKKTKLSADQAALKAHVHHAGPKPASDSIGGAESAAETVGPSQSTAPVFAMSVYEQNRLYHSSVASVPVDDIVDAVTGYFMSISHSETTPGDAPCVLPVDLMTDRRVSALFEQLVVSIKRMPPPAASATAVQRLSLEKIGARLGVFICDALYAPLVPPLPVLSQSLGLVASDSNTPLVEEEAADSSPVDTSASAACQRLFDAIANGSSASSQPFASTSSSSCSSVQLQHVMQLVELANLGIVTPQATHLVPLIYFEACRFESDIQRVGDLVAQPKSSSSTTPGGADAPHQDDDASVPNEASGLSAGDAFHRFLIRLRTSVAVAAAVEQLRQPTLIDLTTYEALDVKTEITTKDWGYVCRNVLEPLGFRKLLGSDPFRIVRGLQSASDDDVATVWDACRWASEHCIRMLSSRASPLESSSASSLTRWQWAEVLLGRLPQGLVDTDEGRCHALFVRLANATGAATASSSPGISPPNRRAGSHDDTIAMTAKHLVAGLDDAFSLQSLFTAEDTGCEGLWESLVGDAASASDQIAARRPSLVEEQTFRAFLAFLHASIRAYLVGERLVLPPSNGHARALPVNLAKLPLKKEHVKKLIDVVGAHVDSLDDEFASLANGGTSAELHHVVHMIGLLAQRQLPCDKTELWRRIGPLLKQLATDEGQGRKFFAFGIDKAHAMHCTVAELHRAIALSWSLDIFLASTQVSVLSLLADAVGVACTTKYPPPKSRDVMTIDLIAPTLTFLHTYLDIIVAMEGHMKDMRARRRSSTSTRATLKLDGASFEQLGPIFSRNGIVFNPVDAADTPTAALRRVFEVLSGGTVESGATCSTEAVAHWAARAAVRKAFVPGLQSQTSLSPARVSASIGSAADERSAVEKSAEAVEHRWAQPHPSSPWTRLRGRLPVGTSSTQCSRRATLFSQLDVTQRKSFITPMELLDGATLYMGFDEIKCELEPVVFRAVTAAKDSVKAFFHKSAVDGTRELAESGAGSQVTPQHEAAIKAAVESHDITPLEFRLVLLYMYQYAEIFYMFDVLSGVAPIVAAAENGSAADGTVARGAAKPKQVTYQDFLAKLDLLQEWGLPGSEVELPDVLFRRINGGRDGVLLFTDFVIWASRVGLHVEEVVFQA